MMNKIKKNETADDGKKHKYNIGFFIIVCYAVFSGSMLLFKHSREQMVHDMLQFYISKLYVQHRLH